MMINLIKLSLRTIGLFISIFFLIPGISSAEVLSTIDLKTYKDQIVYLDFWASWCDPCKKSIPWLNEMNKKYKGKGLKIIGVNVDQEREAASKFMKLTNPEFDIFFDAKGEWANKYKIPGMPTAVLLNKQGNVAHIHKGFLASEKQTYEEQIKQLLDFEKK